MLAVAVAGCVPEKDETISGYVSPKGVWVLQTMNGDTIDPRITISFPEEGRVSGSAPCNSYSGVQSAPLPWFKVAGIASTRRACPELALEQRYFEALTTASIAEVLGDTLLLSGQEIELVFRRNDA